MRLSEMLSLKPNDPENIKRLSNLGAISFGKGLSDKNSTRTPHYEIDTCLRAFEDVSIINSAINQLVSFIVPNKDIKISSKDKKSVEFLEKWHKERVDAIEEIKNLLTTNLVCGNGILENFFAETVDGKKVYDNFFSINDANRVYINPDDIDGPTAFIYELPIGIKQFKYMGKILEPTFYQVQYIKNYTFTFKRVYGVAIPGWKFSQFKSGWSRDNLYGRSQLASAIDAVNIFKEIMSSWDTIAKTRQIDQKIISLADNENPNMLFDTEQIKEIEQKLNNSDNSYNIIGLPLKFIQTDISTSQGFNLMEGCVDVLRRQIMMSLLPQHLTPWNDSATTQGSESAMPPFMLRLKSKQNELTKFLNNNILKQLRNTYTWLADDISYVFDAPKIMSDDYYTRFLNDLMREGVITKVECRNYLLKLGILDEDVFESIEEQPQEREQEKISERLKEAKDATSSFDSFRIRLNQRHTKKPFSTLGWTQIANKEVGGHVIRLIDTTTGFYLLFDGLNFIENYDKKVVNIKQAKNAMEEFIDKLKKSFEEFDTGESEEDLMFDELQKEIQQEYEKRLNIFFKDIDKLSRKKEQFSEGFLSDKIFPKLDDVFSGFGGFINSRVNNIMKKFNVSVIKDDEAGTPDKKTIDMLKAKNDLMSKNLSRNLKTVKDQQIQNIRTQLSQGIASGQDVKDIKSKIEADYNYEKGVKSKIDRAIQTSGRNSVRITKLRKYKAMGFDEVVWITRDDNKVRQQHANMNNKVYKIDKVIEWLVNNTLPGTIYNCRCTFTIY